MFAYSIAKAIQFKIIPKKKYFPMIDKAYKGLRLSCLRTGEGANLIPTKVSGDTCVGDKEYYLTRKITEGTGFGYGSFIMFGLAYKEVVTGKL
jgi:rhamnogalacturonyl hydrolase YesR